MSKGNTLHSDGLGYPKCLFVHGERDDQNTVAWKKKIRVMGKAERGIAGKPVGQTSGWLTQQLESPCMERTNAHEIPMRGRYPKGKKKIHRRLKMLIMLFLLPTFLPFVSSSTGIGGGGGTCGKSFSFGESCFILLLGRTSAGR